MLRFSTRTTQPYRDTQARETSLNLNLNLKTLESPTQMADEPASSFLMKRVKAAKAKAAEQPQQPQQTQITPVAAQTGKQHAVSQPLKPSQPLQSPAKHASATSHTADKPPVSQNEEGTNLELAPAVATSDWDWQVAELFDIHSPNKVALELFRPHLPEIVRKLIAGAKIIGARGHQDRMTIYRMLGAPWTPTASTRGESGQGLDALADRMVRAVTRREGRMTVTLSADVVQEAQQIEGAAAERP